MSVMPPRGVDFFRLSATAVTVTMKWINSAGGCAKIDAETIIIGVGAGHVFRTWVGLGQNPPDPW